MRNTSGLKRTAGPGRPKGSKTKFTQQMHEFWREFLDSPGYRANLTQRILAGKAGQMEAYFFARLHGRPTEHVALDLAPTTIEFVHHVSSSSARVGARASPAGPHALE